MPKVVTAPIASFNQGTISAINNNFDAVEVAIENTLSRDGTAPNQMGADLDMNENDVINVGNFDATRADVSELYLDGARVIPGEVSAIDLLINSPTFVGATSENINSASATNLGKLQKAATITELSALDGSTHPVVYVSDQPREGFFFWQASDQSAEILGPAISSSSVDAGTDTITTASAHGLMTGQAVVTTTAVNGLAVNTIYYVIVDATVANPATYRLATSFVNAQAGTAIDLTGASAVTVNQHYDPLMGIYVTPTADISGASGAWVRQISGGRITPRMFGATGTNTGDDSHPICAAADWLRKSLSTVENVFKVDIDGEGLFYRCPYSLNFTSIKGRGGALLNMNVNSLATDDIGLDCTGSQFFYLDQVVVNGNQGNVPDVGIVFARIDDGTALPFPTAQDNGLGFVQCVGRFKKAAFMNLASEVMHIDSLVSANNYWSNLATTHVFSGNTVAVANFCGLPVSKYQKIGEGSQSLASTIINNCGARRSPAYGYTITSISKANPAVVTISSANATAGAANFGLANGNQIFLDTVVGSDPGWQQALSFRVFTVANLNTSTGTFELSGVDTSGLAGTFTSGILRNDTGPATMLAQVALYREGGGYQTSYSDHAYRIDPRQDSDWNWDIELCGRHETAADHLVKILGNGVSNKVRSLLIRSDNSAFRVSPISVTGVTGSGDITISKLDVVLSHPAQTPTVGLFDSPANVKVLSGRVNVPTSAWVDDWDEFKNGQCFVRWEYDGKVRDDGAPVRKLFGSNTRIDSTGTIAKTAIVTMSMPAGFLTAGDRLIIEHLWSHTGSTNAKTPHIDLGVFTYFNQAIVGATQVTSRYRTVIDIIDTTNQLGGPINLDAYGEIATALVAGTSNLANPQDLVISAQIATATEELDLRSYTVMLERLAA